MKNALENSVPNAATFVKVATDSNPCYDTTIIGQSGAGWTGVGIPMER